MTQLSATFWAVLGLVLIIAEVVTLSFVLLFFGAGALVVALAKLMGLNHLAIEILLFGITGIAGLLLFRRKLVDAVAAKKGLHIDRESLVVLTSKVPAKGRAEIEYQGTTWTALNESDVDLNAGEEVRISRTEGVKLIVAPKFQA